MIHKKELGKNNPLFVEFETDIMINTGQFPDTDFVDVYFTGVEKGEIGKDANRENHNEKSSDEIDIPVAFRFHKIESIEAVMRQLISARKNLAEKLHFDKLFFCDACHALFEEECVCNDESF